MRIGIIVDSDYVPNWINSIIEEVNKYENIEWTVLIKIPSTYQAVPFSLKWYCKLDSILLPGDHNLNQIGKIKVITNPPVLIVLTESQTELSEKNLSEISNSNSDLLLNFSKKKLKGKLLTIPKLGVWQIFFGNEFLPGNLLTGFWEWLHKRPTSLVSVCKLNNDSYDIECLRSSSTKTEYISLSRNQTAIFSTAIDLISVVIRKYSSSNEEPGTTKIRLTIKKNNIFPSVFTLLIAVFKLMGRLLNKVFNKLFFIDQWVLFYSFSSQKLPDLNFHNFKELIPPKDRFWADPFVISENNNHYIFFEELPYKTNKGHISCMQLNQQGKIEQSKIVIDSPYHLSYPFLFQHGENWYMIPESADNNSVDLFECIEFPFQWKFKKSLLDNVKAYDSTIHFHDGKFWLFCTINNSPGASCNDNLYIFFTDDFLNGEWKEHPNNPVISDPTSARPAGRIIQHDDAWYRPSQICVPRYGYGLTLNKIIKLTELNYIEEKASEVIPDWRQNLKSVHTFNFNNEITLADGQIRRLRFWSL
jgi:hypothetical protein